MRSPSRLSRRAALAAPFALLAALPLFALAQDAADAAKDKVVLALKAKKGAFSRSKAEGAMGGEIGGMELQIELKETVKNTFTKVDEKTGEITVENKTEEQKQTVNGQEFPGQEMDVITTMVVRPDGTLVSVKRSDGGKDQSLTAGRIYSLSNLVYPKEAVGVGSKWSHEYKADAETGQKAGKADFEVLAFEKVEDVDTVKIKMAYKDKEGAPAASSEGTFWIEKASGDAVKSEVELKSLEIDAGGMPLVLTGKIKTSRAEGGPLTDPKPEKKDAEKKDP